MLLPGLRRIVVPESHKQRTLRGFNWNFLLVSAQTLLGFGVVVVLARLLPPADFGLLAIAMVFIGFAELVAALGMGPAIIQLKQLQESHLQVATTLSVLMGTTLLVLFWLTADVIAGFFGDLRIADVLRVLSVGLWFSAFAAVSRGLLMRRLDFKSLFKVDVTAYILGYAGVGIVLAVLGYGVWSLVMGTVASLLLSALALLYLSPPRLRPFLARKEVADLIGFGSGFSLNNTINYLAGSLDSMVIGKYLNPSLLGLYNRAYHLIITPLSKIAAALTPVMFPSYAEIQDERARLKRSYLRVVNATALLTFPILAGLAVSAEYVMTGLYGENWGPASGALRILSFAGMLKVIFHLAGPVAQAAGQVFAEMRRQSIYFIILIIGCLALVPYGVEAVAGAVVLGSLWLYLSMAELTNRILDCSWSEFFGAQIPGIVISGVVVLAQLLVIGVAQWREPLAPPLMLAVLVAVSALAFALGFFHLPERIVGDMPAWLVLHYAHHFPAPVRAWLVRRFS